MTLFRKLRLALVAVAMLIVPGAAMAAPADASFACAGYPNHPHMGYYYQPFAHQPCGGSWGVTVNQLCIEIYIPTGGWGWTQQTCSGSNYAYGNCNGYWGYTLRARSDRADWNTPWAPYSIYSYGGPAPSVNC